jgi:hypothetical protein
MTMGRMTMGFQNQKASDWPMSTTATANAAEDTFMVVFFELDDKKVKMW